MKNVDWELYKIFLFVARHGGLTAAAQAIGSSPATLGRRVLQLEQTIGRVLFNRSQLGYTLTPDGELLFEQVQEMEATARRVESWQRQKQGNPLVRVALGTWGARFLCEQINQICSERDPFRLSLKIGEERARLVHRESDIGIRAFKPEESNLAARQMPEVAYAVYRSRLTRAVDGRWIAVDPDNAVSGYLRWPHETVKTDIAITVDRPTAMLDLCVSGGGHCVLPCFIADREPRLERVGEPIPELKHPQWIVMNQDDRQRREIRTVIDRVSKLMKSNATLYAGQRA